MLQVRGQYPVRYCYRYENTTFLEKVRYEYVNKIISFVIKYNMKELNSSIHKKKITIEV